MRDNSSLPQEVRKFLDQYISSVAQLEVLLFLSEQTEKKWFTASQISDELRSEQALVAERLGNLHTAGLLSIKSTASDGEVRYSYSPRAMALRDQVTALAMVYRERRYTVVTYLYERPSSPS